MKILLTQLARLGDIYLTWPTLHALLREHPEAEVHLLVRERYAAACEGLDPRVKVWTLPSQIILEPIYKSDELVQETIDRFENFLTPMLDQGFDQVVNLSFSPFSSYLSHIFAAEGAEVKGYARHVDGFFNTPDEGSAYFYAQVGVGRSNRYHLVDLFAHISGVTLQGTDYRGLDASDEVSLPYAEYVCLHVGASEASKAISVALLRQIVRHLCQEKGLNVVLIGAPSEKHLMEGFVQGEDWQGRLIDLVGETSVFEASVLLSSSYLIIGPDSFPMHIGTLSGTPCINLSSSAVNFWETGPLSQGSRVIYKSKMPMHTLDDVAEAINEVFLGCEETNFIGLASEAAGQSRYVSKSVFEKDFEWELVQALYTGSAYPVLDNLKIYEAFMTLARVSDVAIETIPDLLNPTARKRALELLNQIEGTVGTIGIQVPAVRPVVEWFHTEKIRIGPMELEELAERTMRTFAGMQYVCSHYVGDISEQKESHP